MTTARRPVQSPKPAITRAPAKLQPEPRNPIAAEIMHRVRRCIAESQGAMTLDSVADELEVSRSQFREWSSGCRSTASGDNLIFIIRWLLLHDPTCQKEVFDAKKIRFRGPVENFFTVPDSVRQEIRSHSYRRGLIRELALKHNLNRGTVSKIREDQ